MKALITGASGYLGNALLKSAAFSQAVSLSRQGSQINCDLSTSVPVLEAFDMVVHAAGKAHSVPRTPGEKESFYKVNVTGTKHLLQGLANNAPPHTFVFISSVAVYGPETGTRINETAALLANDPYGESKIKAEQLVKEWCRAHGVQCVILRLPLIVGKNPPGNLGAMIRAIGKGYYLNVGGGKARRSGVLLNDLVDFIPTLAGRQGSFNLTDGTDFCYADLGRLIAGQLGCRPPRTLPLWMARMIATAGDWAGGRLPFNSYALRKLTSDLTFDTSKAKQELGWTPRTVLNDFSVK